MKIASNHLIHKLNVYLVAVTFIFLNCATETSFKQKQVNPLKYVDPFICTEGDHGHWHPSAMIPFGLVKLGPDTYPGSLTADGDYAHSGYDYSDNQIRGFSHFHKGSSGGTKIKDRAGLLSIIPFVNTPSDTFFEKPLTDIDKETEVARPGYYSVHINNGNILAELTASAHVGMHRYTFPSGTNAQLFIHEGNRDRSMGLSCHVISPRIIKGVQNTSWGNFYFVMEFNTPLIESKIWNDKTLEIGYKIEKLENGGVVCEFGDLKNKQLEVRLGVSCTSIESALENLLAECPEYDFNGMQEKTSSLWNNELNKITVEGEEEYKTIFYTSLYHTCFLPVTLTDIGRTYPGLDKKIHKAEGYTHYNDYAFWDSFRTKYPLYSLYQPKVYQDIIKSLRDIYEQADNWHPFPNSRHKPHGEGGFLARGENGYQVYSTCRHEHMLMVVADAYFKGLIDDVEMESLYPHIRKEAMLQMPEQYDKIGFIPARPDQTGEYCWDNWCVAQIAKDIEKDEDYEYFMKRSEYWRNTWDSSLKFFRARAADGSWLDFPEDPAMNREKYTYEGSKWHWRWNILHNMPELIELFGGNENFTKELSTFFDDDLYTAGNQIDLHAPFLFNYSGAPWLTQKWVRKILTEPIKQLYGTHDFFTEPIVDRIYKATPDGYLEEMDDDYGCMSGWYIMSSMGLYQVCTGDPVYQLTAPIFDSVKIRLDNTLYPGKYFKIKANKLSKENIYIQSATLNGKPINKPWILHAEIVKGGKLVYEMGDKPNKKWGQN